MSLPDYFLADLPTEASCTPPMLREACHALRRNRERYLAGRASEQLVETLGRLAADWLQPAYRFRQLALEQGPAATGFSRPVLAKGLDHFFSQITPAQLRALLRQDLGDDRRLDRFTRPAHEEHAAAMAMARGPDLLVHVTAGNIPTPALMSIILGLLVRSAQFVKCASGTSLLPRLFAHSLYEADAKLAACLEIAEWPGGRADLENVLYAEADCLTVTGRDETVRALRQRLPGRVRFVSHGHRVSFAYVTRQFLSDAVIRETIVKAAEDIVAWDQLGCLSPHVFYVERGGAESPESFAERLSGELDAREAVEPRGPLSTELAAIIKLKRDFYQIRAEHSQETQLWTSGNSTAWTVVFESDPLFQKSCLHRFVYVKPVQALPEVLRAAETVRGQVSTVGLGAPPGTAESLALTLAHWGVPRICHLGQMQKPPLTWRHDGRPALGSLIEWADYQIHD